VSTGGTEAEVWRSLLDQVPSSEELTSSQAELVRSLLETVGMLARRSTHTLDLKIADAALKEMAEAFSVFGPYREVQKVTMFGSARTQPDDPVYVLARELAERLADDGWMVVTGAGPGIMQAGSEGAGRERSFGVNIKLPMEQGANPIIASDSKLVEMRYFFTRKLILVKESDAYAVLPGGFGTLDEAFELLTLLQTGKAQPAPIVLVETPGGSYWHHWRRFVDEEAIAAGYVSHEDADFYSVVNSVDEAMDVIEGFYRVYHSSRMVGDLLVMRLKVAPSAAELDDLNLRFADIVVDGRIRKVDPMPPEVAGDDHLELPRIALRFNRLHYGRLRQLIDALNECTGE
jgi:hypothetical protein